MEIIVSDFARQQLHDIYDCRQHPNKIFKRNK
jgi:hypothetical protein